VPEDIPFERHHRAAGGGDVKDVPAFDVLPPDWKDLRGAKGNVLDDHAAARILLPLCRENIANCDREKDVTSLVWSCLLASGFEVFVCFIRGHVGEEEIVVVTSDGSASWPVRQLTPDAVDFLEVQAL
jgi:hypothetical protein